MVRASSGSLSSTGSYPVATASLLPASHIGGQAFSIGIGIERGERRTAPRFALLRGTPKAAVPRGMHGQSHGHGALPG